MNTVPPNLTNSIIIALIFLFCLGVVLDAVGQVTGNFEYKFPPELMEFTREALACALGLRGLQSIGQIGKLIQHRKDAAKSEENPPSNE